MKFQLLILSGFTVLSLHTFGSLRTFGQSFLTARVGNEIDLGEKEYFGLFPSMNNFVSAKITSQDEKYLTFMIITSFDKTTKDTVVIMEKSIAGKLSKYIDNFETVRMKESTINWSVFKGFATEHPPIVQEFNDPRKTTIVKLDGTSSSGKLLWAEDSSIVLWKSDQPYNWRTVDTNAIVEHVSLISTISVEQMEGFNNGSRIGAYASGAFCISYILYLQPLNNKAEKNLSLIFAASIFTAVSSVVGGLLGSIIQPDHTIAVNGSIKQYSLNGGNLTEYSIINSYPPPELVKLIHK